MSDPASAFMTPEKKNEYRSRKLDAEVKEKQIARLPRLIIPFTPHVRVVHSRCVVPFN